jgi:hypothetical protein
VFKSWNNNESYAGYISVTEACFDELRIPSTAPFGVNYRPGSYVIKKASSDQLYVVQPNNTVIRITPSAARGLYGANFKPKTVLDIYWSNYVNKKSEENTTAKIHPGMLVRSNGNNYLVAENGLLREVTKDAFISNRFKEAFVRPISADLVKSIGFGAKLNFKDSVASNRTQISKDSDGDGLSDNEETYVWHTDLNKFDTDGDGYSDGEEVANDKDPLKIAGI